MTDTSAETGIGNRTIAHIGISVSQWVRSVKQAIGAAALAHERRLASEAVGAGTMCDTGMAPETASGLRAWQADLPFFMQSGFGRH